MSLLPSFLNHFYAYFHLKYIMVSIQIFISKNLDFNIGNYAEFFNSLYFCVLHNILTD